VILKAGIKKPHAKDWLIFPENIGKRLSMMKTLSNGELYTILTNKAAKKTIVAMIAGTSYCYYRTNS
jgi:hypothetical protein